MLFYSVAKVRSTEDFQFIEVKTTKAKNVTELPYGVFFGFTQNEEDLFRTQPNYRLCIVHTVLEEFCLIDFNQYESMIQNKRFSTRSTSNASSRHIHHICVRFELLDLCRIFLVSNQDQ